MTPIKADAGDEPAKAASLSRSQLSFIPKTHCLAPRPLKRDEALLFLLPFSSFVPSHLDITELPP